MCSGIVSVRRIGLALGLALLAGILLTPARGVAQSADALVITSLALDRPTLHVLGVQMLISGDQNRNARVTPARTSSRSASRAPTRP